MVTGLAPLGVTRQINQQTKLFLEDQLDDYIAAI
jgi:hypothetical protein